MKEIRLFLDHPKIKSLEDAIDYLRISELANSFKFIWDEFQPDYYIASEHIYFSEIFKNNYLKYKNTPVKICFLRELYFPDFNLFDYITGFPTSINCEDRYSPLSFASDQYYDWIKYNENDIETYEKALSLLDKKTKFCNFLYSNPKAHQMRDKLFYELSTYKKVDSLGMWLNNVEKKGTGFAGHKLDSIFEKEPYKFSIAVENAVCPGYVTEKILTSLQAHTVPLYFGDPNIEDYINPECFINCNNLSLSEIIEKVKYIDDNKEIWAKMICKPWQTKKQYDETQKRKDLYISFWNNIFEQPIELAKRLAIGYHPDNYLQWFQNSQPIFERTISEKIKGKILGILKKH